MVSPNDAKTSQILGVDFGRAHIGLAMAENETKIAFRYGTIANDKGMLENLVAIMEKEKINTVVIGVPGFRNKGEMGDEEMYKGFGEELGKKMPGVEIIFTDEMFSTKMAKENLLERGGKDVEDHEEAARIILQSWLDKK